MRRGEFLVKMIEEKGFNTMSLARASGVPYTTIRSMIERDLSNASIDNVLLISRVLGIEAEALVDPESWLAKEKEAHDIQTIAAHHDGDEWTEEELEEIERFKAFVRMKRKENQIRKDEGK